MPDIHDALLTEAKRHIAAHCECEDSNGQRQVWRFQKGQGYVWVPCKECAAFWKLCEELEKPQAKLT